MMLAGFETSSSTIANACYLLSHPDNKAALNALTSEVDNLGKHADPEQILSLPYLDAAVKETLRLMPPAHVTAREASRDMFVGGGEPPNVQKCFVAHGKFSSRPFSIRIEKTIALESYLMGLQRFRSCITAACQRDKMYCYL